MGLCVCVVQLICVRTSAHRFRVFGFLFHIRSYFASASCYCLRLYARLLSRSFPLCIVLG